MRLFICILLSFVVSDAHAQCPSDYAHVGGRCLLFLHHSPMNFGHARAACQLYSNGDLAVVDDCALLGEISSYIYAHGLDGVDYWVGGSDEFFVEGSWVWLDGSPVAMGAPFWGGYSIDDFEPNSDDVVPSCVNMDSSDALFFHDELCTDLKGALCQRDMPDGTCGAPFTFVAGGCYEFWTIEASWEDARTVCQNSGADLAIVDDCSVMTELIDYISAAGIWSDYWIGGSKVGSAYQWVDGSSMPLGVPFWGRMASGLQPNNYAGVEHCIALFEEDRYYFNDDDCAEETSIAPLCEVPVQNA